MRRYGRMVTLLGPDHDTFWKEARLRNLTVSYELMLTPMFRGPQGWREHQAATLARAAKMLDDKVLEVHVAQVYLLAEAASAHRRLEAGGMYGKIVPDIDGAQEPCPGARHRSPWPRPLCSSTVPC